MNRQALLHKNKGVQIIIDKSRSVIELLKVRLTLLVLFSGGFGYILASRRSFDFAEFLYFLVGSFLLTGAANIANQLIEKDLDLLMNRTKKRPLPTLRLSVSEAIGWCISLGMMGFLLLISKVNVSAAFFTIVALLLYALVYTPLKRITPFCVLVGAIPGAMPPLIGWIARTGTLEIEAIVLFSIQFIWQFPHFWAIAWILNDDYQKAGFKMLPSSEGKTKHTAFQIMVYTFFLIPFGLLPFLFRISGFFSALLVTVCGLLFFLQTFVLWKRLDDLSAKKIMFGSFIYLPIIQFSIILDKI